MQVKQVQEAGEGDNSRYRFRGNMMHEDWKTERKNRGLYIQSSIPPNIMISTIRITNISRSESKLSALSSRMTRIRMYKCVLG